MWRLIMDKAILKSLAIICSVFLLTSCGGGGANISQSTTTMGQELMDLDKSYKEGIITEKEYKRAKEDILERYE
jgi:hypothetical protein